MNINTVENDIIAQLQSNITGLKIEGFPDNPSEYKLIHPRGAALVQFKGASFSKPDSTAFIQQEVNLDFSLILMIKGLRDKNGAYTYINSIMATLTGYTPTGCGKMYPVGVYFLTEKNGIWQYTLKFTVPTENYS